MDVTCQFAIHPLGPGAGEAIDAALGAVRRRGLTVEVGRMSSLVEGPDEVVFAALRDAFLAAANGDCVMTLTVSNACGEERR